MHLKKVKIFRLSLLILLVGTAILSVYALSSGVSVNNDNGSEKGYINTKELRLSQTFEFIQDFEASSSYISPESSPGFNDEVFFSFMTNKEGNYTLNINNFPSLLTNTIEEEASVAFDNPSGTDLWYMAYLEIDFELEGTTLKRFGNNKIKFLKSEDKGITWNSTTVATLTPSGGNILELINDLSGCAIAAYPEKGIVGIVSWYNTSDLYLYISFDNGTTWEGPKIVATVEDIGYSVIPGVYPFHLWHGGPPLEIGILKNESIYVITEKPSDNPYFTSSIYFESHNNGTNWSGAKNITVMEGSDFAEPVKMQVDHESGDYWLMWEHQTGFGYNISWAQFQEMAGESLQSSVVSKTVYSDFFDCSFDFLYDKKNNLFRVIQILRINSPSGFKYEVINRTISNFGEFWTWNSLGFHSAFFRKAYSSTNFNFAFDGKFLQFFYEEIYSAYSEVYQYYLYEDPIFWDHKGYFDAFKQKQIFWNGRTKNDSPINISTVQVVLFIQNNTEVLNRTLYITIDNEYPEFDMFNQKMHYFNPLSSNITLSQIPWDLLSSEECSAFLEIFKQGSSLSDWQRISDNNWHEMDPKIFRSDTGELYILYSTMEVGTSTVNLIKSFDNGITWSNPVEITTIVGQGTAQYWGAASGHVVIIYLYNPIHFDHVIYRSFDGGETFEPPYIPPDLNIITSATVSKLILTRNKTLFLSYFIYPDNYRVLRSNTLGLDWTLSSEWSNHSAYFSSVGSNRLPDLAYDIQNDLLHISMPYINSSGIEQYRVANFTFATLNVSSNTWGSVKSIGTSPFPIGNFRTEPRFLIVFNDNPLYPIKIRAIYIHEQEIIGGITNYTFKEITSTDLGETWTGPNFIKSNNATVYTSSLFDIFYVSTKSDGHDYEVYFSREGSLVKATQESLSPTIVTEISFDGKDDFGEYISEGNYSYNIILRDDAGNQIMRNGWFYADYNAPQITNHIINWTITPIPRFNVEVTVNVTHEIDGFSTYLYYKKDQGNWQIILMNHVEGDQYSAVIPGDSIANLIQYYIKSVDLAGNEYNLDRDSLYYTYDMPRYDWDSEGLFKESESYSSSQDYEIEVEVTHDLEYVDEVIFQYSYDEGDEWEDLELEQSSPQFKGELKDIPGDLRVLYYKVILIDIFGNEISLTSEREVEFYPETPSIELNEGTLTLMIIISAIIGILVATGYIKLKSTSHETLYKQIFMKEYAKKTAKSKKLVGKALLGKVRKRDEEGELKSQLDALEQKKIASPFTSVYLAILISTIIVFTVAIMIAVLIPEIGMLLLAGSLLMAVFGYMILMSRDITINIYLEKIHLKNIAIETFQIFFMFMNIVMILLVGYTIDWFRYYLIESTFNFGVASIPRLYISIFLVFFTSLVLVGITTYIQLKKTVKKLQDQRMQGTSANLLLYLKDQDSSRLITRLGYKTIVFLITVLIGIVTTTNLLTEEITYALIIIIIPFALSSFLTLIIQRYLEMRSKKEQKEEIQLPFSDSKKFCSKCGKEMYLSNRFCGSCGSQQIYEDLFGTYVSRCSNCNSLINDKAQYCTECGEKLQTIEKMKE